MNKTLRCSMPATGLSAYVASRHTAFTAPDRAGQGTGLPFAGVTAAAPALAQVAALGARVTDLPGSPSRGAPV